MGPVCQENKMSKKKGKNSDYRYLQRTEDERREAARKAEIKRTQSKERWMYVLGLVFLFGSVIVGIIAYVNQMTWLAPYYSITSALGMFLLGFHYRDKRDKYSKLCIGLGIGMLVLAFFMFRGTFK